MNTQKSILEPEAPKNGKGPLTVTKIEIHNVWGLEEFGLEPNADFNLIRGKNGTGKTSVILALANAFSTGTTLGQLARVVDGVAQEPKMVVILDGPGSERYELTKTAKDLKIKQRVGNTAAFKEISETPAAFMRRIADGEMVSPAKFLLASPKDQLAMYLESLPCTLDMEKVKQIVGEFQSIIDEATLPLEFLHPIQAVVAMQKEISKERKGVGVTQDEKRKTAYQTRLEAPAETPEDLGAQIDASAKALEVLVAKISRDVQSINSVYRETEAAAAAQRDAAINAAKLEFERRCSEAKSAAANDREAIEAMRKDETVQRDALGALRRLQTQATEAKTKIDMADKFEAEADSLKGKYERMTAVLAGLEVYKESLADAMPIKGITTDGGLKVDGIEFNNVNNAKRVEIAFNIGLFRLGRLRVMLVDDMERLDSDTRSQIIGLAAEHDIQMFVTEVKKTGPETLEVEKSSYGATE